MLRFGSGTSLSLSQGPGRNHGAGDEALQYSSERSTMYGSRGSMAWDTQHMARMHGEVLENVSATGAIVWTRLGGKALYM